MNPRRRAIGVVLMLPDRHARLDLVDHEATRSESRVAVRGCDANEHGDVTDGQQADAMLGNNATYRKPCQRFNDDRFTLARSQFRIGLVAQRGDGTTPVVIAHHAIEPDHGAAMCIFEQSPQRYDIDATLIEPEERGVDGCHVQPPDTGGRNTTSSPS